MTEKLNLPSLRDRFPKTEVETTQGKKILPDDYEGKWFILFSHPGDFTPVCTSEFESFAMSLKEFNDINCELIGVSLDTVAKHQDWIDWINDNAPAEVTFPIIGGESANEIAEKLGMVHENYGNASVRAVFIVDDTGLLRLMMYYPMEIGRSISEIVRSVKALQLFDKRKVMTPADYPNNKWLGENAVLMGIPKEEEDKKKIEELIKADVVKTKAPWFNYMEK